MTSDRIPIQRIIGSLESRQPDPCFRIFIIIYICRFLFYSSVSLRYRTGILFICIYIIYYGYATNAGARGVRGEKRFTTYKFCTYSVFAAAKLVPVVCKSYYTYDTYGIICGTTDVKRFDDRRRLLALLQYNNNIIIDRVFLGREFSNHRNIRYVAMTRGRRRNAAPQSFPK